MGARGAEPLVEILRAGGVREREMRTWLTSSSSLLSGEVPVEVAHNDPERAQRAARRFAAERERPLRLPVPPFDEQFRREGRSFAYLDDEGNIVREAPPDYEPKIIGHVGDAADEH